MRRLLLLLALCFGGALAFAGSASAHATVVGSSPTDGQRLAHAPATVTIDFDEQVGIGTLGYLNVTDEKGQRVQLAAATHPGGDGTKVSVALKSGLGNGTYTESYRVISADSHPVSGVVRFVVGNGPLTAATVHTTTSDGGVAAAFDIVRWVSYAGFALLGGGWLLLTVWEVGRDDARARRIVWFGWVFAAVGAVLELLLEGTFAAGQSVVSSVKPSLIDATLHTDYGQLHSARLLLLGVLAVVFGLALQPGQVRHRLDNAFWLAGLGIAYTFSASGHPATTNPTWLSIGADMLHLSAMAVWVGGLVLVVGALLPRREPDELRAVLPVFSQAAFASVVVLAVTGTYAAWRGVGSWRAFFHTEYGWLVIVKIVLFIGLLTLGNLSRVLVQRRARGPIVAYAMTDPLVADEVELDDAGRDGGGVNDDDGGGDDGSGDDGSGDDGDDEFDTERMRRSVLVEVVVAAIVLAFTALLVSQPRGAEALQAQDRRPVTATAQLGGGRTATVTVDPGQHGVLNMQVALSSGAQPASVTGTATEPAQELGPIPVPLAVDGHDLYTAGGVDLPVAGHWVIALVVTYSQFNAVSTDVQITLK